MRVFIDTNILLDYACQRNPFVQDATELFRHALKHDITIIVSALTIVNTKYTAKKYGYSNEEIDQVILNLLKTVSVSSIDETMIREAFMSNAKDTEDMLQILSAKSAMADYIVTREKTGFSESPIPVYSPRELSDIMRH